MQHFFAPCPRGLEPLLVEDLTAAGAENIVTVPGGASFSGDWHTCYQVNLWTRIATRVLWQVAHGSYKGSEDIYRLAFDLPWQRWFNVTNTLRVYMTAIRSPLKSIDFATLRIKDAICDRFRAEIDERPSVDTAHPDIRIHTFLTADEVTLYIDTSGEALYKRGFKQASVEAPIKENLAAGILRLAGWQASIPLLDPMCGSGTFLIEAAQIALDIAPGLTRSFGFERLLNFDAALWNRILTEAQARKQSKTTASIFGSDTDYRQIEAAKENLHAAGLDKFVELKQINVLDITAPAPTGMLITNPPYGVRLTGDIDPVTFYPLLGDKLKQQFSGWNAYLLSADISLPKLIYLKASRRTPLYNGDLECRLYEYRMISGTLRKPKQSLNAPSLPPDPDLSHPVHAA